jgi:CopA family copper-resistance protein
MTCSPSVSRRTFFAGGAAALGLSAMQPAWAQSVSHGAAAKGFGTLTGPDIDLTIAQHAFDVNGRLGHAVTINGSVPGPVLRMKEGETARLTVNNHVDEDTSIHWHGLLVPFAMDGVPGVSFPGIKPRSTFVYEFPLIQSGTYWYHSHSGLQEQLGHYGPIIIDPKEPDPVASEREHVIVLSDWTFMHPHTLFLRLKQQGGFFNRQKLTLADRLGGNVPLSPEDREMFARMRMDPTDISDIGAAAYEFLINGHSPRENWTGLFRAGERVRLRIINAATQTIFNLRIPGLPMTVVAADGVAVRPVDVDELQIGNAETYDVIVVPNDQAYSFVAETIDRSGMGVATLAPRAGMRAGVPPLRDRPILGMKDMGMDHSAHAAGAEVGPAMDHSAMDHSSMDHSGMDHSAMGHSTAPAAAAASAGMAGMDMRDKAKVDFPVGPGVDMIAPMPMDRVGDPGVGLDNVGHRVLNYRDLASLRPRSDARAPTRMIEIHLTGNMERFMWSLDGQKLSENPEPYRFARDERVRLRLINDTMMTHPMHLHGHFFEIVNGHGAHQPLKHTVRVPPGGYVDLDLTADAPGDWAFHCHLLYHMHAGMMRVVKVRPLEGDAA